MGDRSRSFLLVTTCGTSLLTNNSGEDRGCLTKLANVTKQDLAKNSDSDSLVARIEKNARKALEGKNQEAIRKASAELNGAVLAMRHPTSCIDHLLVYSDTALGERCANLVREYMPGECKSIVLLTAGGLRTDDVANFRAALDDLTKRLLELIDGYIKKGYEVCFNLSGGWKSVNAYLQGIAMLRGIPCVFVFEGSNELLEIPRLPARLDADEVFKNHHDVFRRIDSGYALTATDVDGIPESLLSKIDGAVELSLWGDVLWTQAREAILGENLLPSLSDKLHFARTVEKDFLRINERDRRIKAQKKLDMIAHYLDTNNDARQILASLKGTDLKELRKNPKPPSTHEFDLWPDGAAWRAFVHFEKDTMICDSLGEALH